MKKLTAIERRIFYLKAAKFFLDKNEPLKAAVDNGWYNIGFCGYVGMQRKGRIGIIYSLWMLREEFPEYYLFKTDRYYWFDDNTERATALLFAAEMTKTENL